jgi:hypothetical protein
VLQGSRVRYRTGLRKFPDQGHYCRPSATCRQRRDDVLWPEELRNVEVPLGLASRRAQSTS